MGARGSARNRSAEPAAAPVTTVAMAGDVTGPSSANVAEQSSNPGGFAVLGLGGLTVAANANVLGNTVLGDNALTTVLISGDTQMNGDLAVSGAGSFVSIGAAPAASGALRLSADAAITWAAGGAGGVLAVAAGDTVAITVNGNQRVTLGELGVGGSINLTGGGNITGGSSVNLNAPTVAIEAGNINLFMAAGAVRVQADATGLGFFGGAGVAKPTVTGSRGGNAALTSLLTALAALGLVTDSST